MILVGVRSNCPGRPFPKHLVRVLPRAALPRNAWLPTPWMTLPFLRLQKGPDLRWSRWPCPQVWVGMPSALPRISKSGKHPCGPSFSSWSPLRRTSTFQEVVLIGGCVLPYQPPGSSSRTGQGLLAERGLPRSWPGGTPAYVFKPRVQFPSGHFLVSLYF